MSNGTRKKVVDFKKLLVNVEENKPVRKKGFKLNHSNQNSAHKKDKNTKTSQKIKENQSKASDKIYQPKKPKTKNNQKKEQISLIEFTSKLNDYTEELAFLNKKRNTDLNIDKILSLKKNNQNKTNTALNININNKDSDSKNKNNSKNKKTDDTNSNADKNEINNENSTLIIDFYKLYYHLFESNRLDNSKPYKFVDYLITGDNLLFNLKKDKSRFEEIKKGISLKTKNNSVIYEQLLNKYIYEYLRCDFSNSFMKKLTEKINVFLMNRYINKKKERNSLENSISIEKKDKFTYSNFLADKLKDNTNKSILSFTNDTEYLKSLIYVCNKYSKYIGKKEIPEKILIESLEKNKKILENFKNVEQEDGDNARKIEKGYLNDLLHSKSIRKYITKKLKNFNGEMIEHNKILNSLDTNTFYKILSSLIKNKNDDDIDKLYKLFEEEIFSDDNNKLNKNDLKNFIILLRFLLELELTNKLNNDKIPNNQNNSTENNNNDNKISLMKDIYENINNILSMSQKINESENSLSNSGKKKKVRNRIKIKSKNKLENIPQVENEMAKIEEKDNSNNNIIQENDNSIISINQNQNQQNNISNLFNENMNNNNKENADIINVKTKKRNKNSKIIPFKIPYPINNLNINNSNINNNSVNINNYNINSLNNKINNSLFEINNANSPSSQSPQNITDNNNDKNISIENIHSDLNNVNNESQNDSKNVKDVKEKTRIKRCRKKNVEENMENISNSLNDSFDNKNANNSSNENSLIYNKCITFCSMNHNLTKDINFGKLILNSLSSGKDIFKLIIEKPKVKKNKEKEISEVNSVEKSNENDDNNLVNKTSNNINNKEEENTNNENSNKKENNNNKDNVESNANKEMNKENSNKKNKRIKNEKIKEESNENSNNKIKEEKKEEKEEKEIVIKNEKEENIQIKKENENENNNKDIIIKNEKIDENQNHEEKEKEKTNGEILIENKINNMKKEGETKDNSSKSTYNNDKDKNCNPFNFKKINLNNNIFYTKNDTNRNIDIIHFNNGMIQEGEPIKEITRNDLKHSPNICVKISQKSLKSPTENNDKKNTELIFNINNACTKYFFSTNKNNYNNIDTKSKIIKNKGDMYKRDSFKNINIQIDRQSVEIKGGNVILNDIKENNKTEDCNKIKDYFNNI